MVMIVWVILVNDACRKEHGTERNKKEDRGTRSVPDIKWKRLEAVPQNHGLGKQYGTVHIVGDVTAWSVIESFFV